MATAATDRTSYCERLARSARAASRELATLPGRVRDRALLTLARLLREQSQELLQANEQDLGRSQEFGLTAAQTDRLRLSKPRLDEMAVAVEQIAEVPDPVGRIIESTIRPNGLEVQKLRVPLGVILFIYESRPNVTTDAAAVCLKSGNAVILRGGKEARQSNAALGRLIARAWAEAGVPADAVAVVDDPDRQLVGQLLSLNQYIDLVIPRGGEALIRRVADEATMPVLKHYKGVCHVYIDASADLEMAVAITENSKCQRPGVCNAAETLLVHESVARGHLPVIADRLRACGVELRGCPKTCALVAHCRPATEDDYYAEFLDLILAVKVVADVEEAIEHIGRYGSGHTEAIVTRDLEAARRFTAAVDSAAVLVNASTRFNDGGQFGLGTEIGISTDKLPVRGPCGVNELTSYKYVVYGSGQLRT